MVKGFAAGLACAALAGCQLSLDVCLPDGGEGQCGPGAYCGTDNFCHVGGGSISSLGSGSQGTNGSSTGRATGVSAGTASSNGSSGQTTNGGLASSSNSGGTGSPSTTSATGTTVGNATATGTGNQNGTTSGSTGVTSGTISTGSTGSPGASSGAAASATGAGGSIGATSGGTNGSGTTGGVQCTIPPIDGGSEQVVTGTVVGANQGGWLYVQLLDVSRNGNGLPAPVLQTSQLIQPGEGSASFVLHGAQFLSPTDFYAVAAFIDTLGNGVPNVGADAVGITAPGPLSNFVGGAAVFVGIESNNIPLAEIAPRFGGAARGSNGDLLVLWQPSYADAGLTAEAADSYLVCATDGGAGKTCSAFPTGPGNTGIALLPAPPSFTQVSIQGFLDDGGGGISVGPVTAPSGPGKLSGKVVGGPGGNAPVYVVAVGGSGSFALTTADAGSFAFNNLLPNAAYQLFTFADELGLGALVPGDPTDLVAGGNLQVCFTGQQTCDPVLSGGRSVPSVAVQTTSDNDGELEYALVLDVAANQALPVSASVQTDATETIDLPLQANGPPVVALGTTLPSNETLPPSCVLFDVTYADSSSEQLGVAVSFIPSLPSDVSVTGQGAVTWAPVTGGSGQVLYTVEVLDRNCNTLWDSAPTKASSFYPIENYNADAGNQVIVVANDAAGNSAYSANCQHGGGGSNGGTTGGTNGGGTNGGTGGGGTTNPVTLTGTVNATGFSSSVVFVQLFDTSNTVMAGTAVLADAGGTFTIHSPSGGNNLTAWADVAGTGHFIPALDPSGYSNLPSGSGSLSVGTIPLALPTLPPPSSAFINEVYTGDTGFLVMANASLDSNNVTELASAYLFTLCLMADGGFPIGALTVPAGGARAALLTQHNFPELTLGSLYYLTLTAENAAGSAESPVWGPISFPPTSQSTFSGSLTDPYASGLVYVGGYSGFQTNLLDESSYVIDQFPQAQDLWYLTDANGDGVIEANEPSFFPPTFQTGLFWDGGAAAPSLYIPNTGVTCGFNTASSQTAPDAGATYAVTFQVQSNLEIPLVASILSGPNLSGPIDLGISNQASYNQPQAVNLAGVIRLSPPAVPHPGDTYVFDVVTTDGGSSTYLETLENVYAPPTGLAIDLTGQTVSWNWTSPIGAYDGYTFIAQATNAQQEIVWFYPSNQNGESQQAMVVPISDGNLYNGGLQPGAAYVLSVQIQDPFGNSATGTASIQL